jgi:hypothetical protein
MHLSAESLFWVAFAGVALFLVFRAVRYGGLKAAMFGAKIERTIGEVVGERRGGMRAEIKVHALAGSPGQHSIGIEFVAKGPLSYQMLPITLSLSEARNLAQLLQRAVQPE